MSDPQQELRWAIQNSPLFRQIIDQAGGLGKPTYEKHEFQALATAFALTLHMLADNSKLLLQATQQLQQIDHRIHQWANPEPECIPGWAVHG